MRPYVFVTGMPRSGTTLLDKLISLHPDAHVLSQPLPLLYVEVKRAFLNASDEARASGAALARRYPLNDMFARNYYPPPDFLRFLESHRLGLEFCRRTLEEMVDFDGQYTKPERPLDVLNGYSPSGLWTFVMRYAEELLASGRHALIGSKEAFCEEYIPYFLKHGSKVLLILRDPRDIVASLDHGKGKRFGGASKPLLFNLRQWRKSVSFGLAHESQPNFLAVRYEDLVEDPRATIERLCSFLGLSSHAGDVLDHELRTQSGEVWLSNSSHFSSSRITTKSVGRYRRHLSRRADRFVQACCLAEMRELGFEVTLRDREVESILADGPPAETRAAAELAGFEWDACRRAEELERLERLRGGGFDPRYFVFESSFARLRRHAAA